MKTIAPETETEAEDSDFKPLTAQEAEQWRRRNPPVAAKIVLTIALLVAAPRVVPGLNWLALVAGLVITMKTYWVALMVRPGVRKTD